MNTERRLIDPEQVDAALAGLGDRGVVEEWARRFSLVADPSRLTLLVCIHYAKEIYRFLQDPPIG